MCSDASFPCLRLHECKCYAKHVWWSANYITFLESKWTNWYLHSQLQFWRGYRNAGGNCIFSAPHQCLWDSWWQWNHHGHLSIRWLWFEVKYHGETKTATIDKMYFSETLLLLKICWIPQKSAKDWMGLLVEMKSLQDTGSIWKKEQLKGPHFQMESILFWQDMSINLTFLQSMKHIEEEKWVI